MDVDDERAAPAVEAAEAVKPKKLKAKKVKKMPMVETPSMIMGSGSNDGFGSGGLGLVALLALLGGRGRGGLFGGDGDGAGIGVATLQSSIDTNSIMNQLSMIQAAVPLAESQVQLALAGVNSNLQSQGLQQTIALQQQGFQGQLATLAGFNSLGDKVDALSAATALAIANNQFACVTATQVDGEKTRDLINSINNADLNRIITTQAAQLAELQNESNRANDRHGVEVTMINNQNQNQMQFQQQAQVLGTLTNGLAQALQSIHATNQAINIGAGTQTANPTNTNTNVRA